MRSSAFFTVATVCLLAASSATAQFQLNPPGQVQMEDANPAWQNILAAQADGATNSDKRQFVFRCSTTKKKSELLQSFRKNNEAEKNEIIAIDNEPAKIASVSQRPFVTGVQAVGKTGQGEVAYQPLVTALDEGSSIELTIKSLDDKHVQVDAQFNFTELGSVDEFAVGERNTQAVTHRTVSQRVVRTVRLGEPAKMTMPGLGAGKPTVIQYAVTEYKPR